MIEQLRQGRPKVGDAVRRALLGKCPNCGRGKLFASYLKQVDHCAVCREPYGHLRSDDAAPWLTILVVGHIVVPIVLAVESRSSWPTWISMMLWPVLALALVAFVLPRAKALFLSVIWATGAPGSGRE